jgi:hypothetical protein
VLSRSIGRRVIGDRWFFWGDMMMRRLFMVVAATAMVLVMGWPAAANGPAQHFSEPVVGDTFVCESGVYTAVSGELRVVIHEGESQGGTSNFTGTLVPKNVRFEDAAGNEFFAAGAIWFGGSFNTRTGGLADTFTFKIHIISADGGGTVGVVNFTAHVSPTGDEFFKVHNTTCEPPPE